LEQIRNIAYDNLLAGLGLTLVQTGFTVYANSLSPDEMPIKPVTSLGASH